MNHKNGDEQENLDEDEPGFRINLPFGLGWLRGDGSHLSALLPVVRWVLLTSSALYLILRIVQEWRQS